MFHIAAFCPNLYCRRTNGNFLYFKFPYRLLIIDPFKEMVRIYASTFKIKAMFDVFHTFIQNSKHFVLLCMDTATFYSKVHVSYTDSALNMDTPNIFRSNKFYRRMALHIHEEKQSKDNLAWNVRKRSLIAILKETCVLVV